MADVNDMELLRDYADRNSEAAFSVLVHHHLNLVYSVAFRCTGHEQDAKDVAQAVFIILAKKAVSLRHRTSLTGWLYETTRLTARQHFRTRVRRQTREQEAYMQSTLNETSSDDLWLQLAPLLEEGMARLSEDERALVALRFFENKSGAEMARAAGLQESAARKRVDRAILKLQKFFQQRGLVHSTSVLTAAISANSIHAAPMAFANTVTAVALTKVAAGSSILTLSQGALKIMAWSKAQTIVVGIVIAGLAVYSVVEHQAQNNLRAENEALRRKLKPQTTLSKLAGHPVAKLSPARRVPAPAPATIPSVNVWPTNDFSATNLYARVKDKTTLLTHDQVEAFLKTNGRNAAHLLAAFRNSGDATLLKEAMQKYPNDPQVAFEATIRKDLPPEEQRAWLNNLLKSAPDNAMANYLSAANYFVSGQADQGLRELTAASGKSMNDYSVSREQEDMEAFLDAGYSLADAKTMAARQLELPQLFQLKQLSLSALDLAGAYRQANDPASAQSVLQMTASLGRRYSNPSPGDATISQLFGLSVESRALQAMDINAPYGDNGGTVQDRLDQIAQERATVKDLSDRTEALLPKLTDNDWIIYKDRWLMFGEKNAEQWVVGKYGSKQQ